MLSSFLKNEPQKNKFSQVWNNIEGERERELERGVGFYTQSCQLHLTDKRVMICKNQRKYRVNEEEKKSKPQNVSK